MKKNREYYRKFNWSKYQRDVFAEVVKCERHIAIEAVAGSGKTTTLKGLVHWLPSKTKIRIFAFNKSVADKLEGELPSRVAVGTAHSYGYAMLMSATRSYEQGLFVDGDKYWKLASAAVSRLLRESENDFTGRFPNLRDERVCKTLLQGIFDTCHIIRVALAPFKFQDIRDYLELYGVVIPAQLRYWVIKLAMDCIIQGNKQSQAAHVDFDDMLWMPHLWKLRPLGKVNFIFVDEAQDTTAASQSLYRKFVEDGAILVAVGDSRQSIFGFAGSLADAFNQIKAEFTCKELSLPVSYRCPTSHLALARQIVPHILPKDGAIKGIMETVDYQYFFDNASANNLVLSRMTAPLVRTCIDLTLQGKRAKIRGTEIAEGLCATATTLVGNNSLARFPHELHLWLQSKIGNAQTDFEADNATDTAYALQACYEMFGGQCFSIQQFCDQIRGLFAPDDMVDCIILSTIHRAKGDEAGIVWLLNSNELPPEREDWNQEQQEENLVYVAITRAIEALYFVTSNPVNDNVGGIRILEDIDWDELPDTPVTPPTAPAPSQQLALF